ncbi:hypothetical protein A8C56_11885 [Niabella ginsenosidivorans]|uniref:DUF4397 domain-containing protein n=1 Tax=Niabella ginsenosidivorans TaxID=1176587 RepID=A0A1A9I4G6_9BACT|nr:DUF4397 domain-containing protein [Niabella ginsenosidivorans]ANH81582.1 hypothetical protein A8C56_11885 [Niabella ginsenosidivorans]
MKTKYLVSYFLLLLVSISFTSCLKDHDKYWDNPDLQNSAAVSVVNGAPVSLPLDFQFNGTQRFLFQDFSYTYRTTYLPVMAGNRTFYVYNRGEKDSLFAKNLSFEVRKRYSIFIVDTLRKMDAVLVRDSVMYPTGDSVYLRFANMSPDAGALDLYIQGNNTPIATKVPYKGVSLFKSQKSAGNVVFEVRPTGSTHVLATSDEGENLYTGNQYTIWTSGFKSMNTTNGKLIVKKIRHY